MRISKQYDMNPSHYRHPRTLPPGSVIYTGEDDGAPIWFVIAWLVVFVAGVSVMIL